MPNVNFSSFTAEASPVVGDYLVGYRTAVAGGERRTTLTSLLGVFQAASAYLSAIDQSLATSASPTFGGLTVSKSIAANTVGNGLTLVNPTAATAANQRYSPYLEFQGFGHQTSGSYSVKWRIFTIPSETTSNPNGKLSFQTSVDGAAFAEVFSISNGSGAGSVNAASFGSTGAMEAGTDVIADNQLRSLVATGTAPLTVNSTTLVANLHAAVADSATTATTATNATNVGITNDTTTNATMFPLWATANTGNLPAKVTSTKLTFNPSTGILASTGFTGTLNGNTFTAGTYTLTGTAAKTLNFTNSLTLTGTDGTTMTFPTTSATLARTDAANTFTGTQTIGALVATTVNGNTITTGSSTFTGTAGQTYTFPTTTATIARTDAANTFTGVQTMTSPSITTSLVTASTTFALLNATATTVNAFGAATTLNIGASATCILNFGGGTTASEFRFLEPSGSGTNYTAFKAQAQSANITYTLPATVGGAGTVLTDAAGNGTLSWTAAGAGTVTVVSTGSLTSTALVTGGGTTTLQTPSATATMDSSGNISTPGSITTGAGGSVAGCIELGQGTAPTAGTTSVKIYVDTAVTSYLIKLPASVGSTGVMLWTVSGTTATLSSATTLPSGITLVAPVLGTPASGTLTNCTGLPISGLVASTSTALGVGTIELGAASDTTISRVSAGVIAVEGVTVDTISATNTLTNKRVTARVTTITSSATPTVNTDNCDCVTITALSAAITSMTTNLSGTPVNFDQLEYRIKDDGTARAITWGATFVAGPTALPTTTTISKALHVYFEYDSVQTKWVCMSSGSDA